MEILIMTGNTFRNRKNVLHGKENLPAGFAVIGDRFIGTDGCHIKCALKQLYIGQYGEKLWHIDNILIIVLL